MVFSFLLGANVLIEKVFAWPGIGSYAVEALIASDYAPVQGFVLTMALLYVLLNLTIDLVYGLLDPRMRSRHEGTLRHARYVLAENPLTACLRRCSFCLRGCRVRSGDRPYDPLASDTAQALQGPSAAHWFGTDQLGRASCPASLLRPGSISASPAIGCARFPTADGFVQ